MSTVIRAEAEPVAARLDHLRHAVRDTIVPFDLRVEADPNVRCQIVTHTVGDVRVTRVTGPPGEVMRNLNLIRGSDPSRTRSMCRPGAAACWRSPTGKLR